MKNLRATIALLAVLLVGRTVTLADAATEIGDPKPPAAPATRDSTTAPDSTLARHRTQAGTGGKAGALFGGAIGAGFFLLAAAYADGESSDDLNAPEYIGFGMLGAAVGGALGWGLGSLLGSMVPAEPPPHPVPTGSTPPVNGPAPTATPTSEPYSPLLHSPRSAHTLASFTLLGGYIGESDAGEVYEYPPEGGAVLLDDRATTQGGALLAGRLLRHRGEWVSYGPEIGYVFGDDGPFLLTADLLIGKRFGSIRPFVIGDIGWHSWRDGASLLGAGVGGGLEWQRAPGATAFGLEYRHRGSVQNDTGEGDRTFDQVAITTRFSW